MSAKSLYNVFKDEAEERGVTTGEVLRERGLCRPVILRTTSAGVHVGLLAHWDAANREAHLLDARRIWQWEGANTLHEVAVSGIAMSGSRVSQPIPQCAIMDVIEVLPVYEAAFSSLFTSRW